MTELQAAVVSVLWLVGLVIMGLLLLVYRQLDRAYGAPSVSPGVLLPVGAVAPAVEVIDEHGKDGLGWLEYRQPTEWSVLIFVDPECQACLRLLEVIHENKFDVDRFLVVASAGEIPKELVPSERNVQWYGMTHPGNVRRDFGVHATPVVYVLKGATVLAARSVSTKAALEELLTLAAANERLLAARGDTYEQVVSAVLDGGEPLG